MALVDQSSMETTVAVGKDCRGVELVAVEQAAKAVRARRAINQRVIAGMS